MEVEEIQSQAASSKFPRLSDDVVSDENRLRGWHHSSRIIRVSRASGGKDRHSKVWTSKGLRDRRVRLSVTTAIQFYDLQDRLGYDQPSKAVEWLIKAAAEAISELPSLSGSFPETPKQLTEMELEGGDRSFQINPQVSLSKSSSTSETSKGSGLSLSQSEVRVNRVKASRERARERAAKEKEKEDRIVNLNPVSNSSSFTELLTGGGGATSSAATVGGTASVDYFSSGLLGRRTQGFQLGNSIYNVAGDGQFSFVPDNFISSGGSGGSDYNLNFTISGGFAGYNSRGTLQSNLSSPSFLPHLQRFASPIDGSNVPFFIGAAAPVENHHHHQHLHHQHHQFSAGFDGHKKKEKSTDCDSA